MMFVGGWEDDLVPGLQQFLCLDSGKVGRDRN